MFYRQCIFKQGNTQQTAWIEERGAKVGCRVTFKDDASGFWEVVSVSDQRLSEKYVKEHERDHLGLASLTYK